MFASHDVIIQNFPIGVGNYWCLDIFIEKKSSRNDFRNLSLRGNAVDAEHPVYVYDSYVYMYKHMYIWLKNNYQF